jgi:hypothetical protein
MTTDPDFLRSFYRRLDPQIPADPSSGQYVKLYESPDLVPTDPVGEIKTTIEWSLGESAQLFSGFRGTGKTTELLRLEQELSRSPENVVVRCDMQDYLNLSTPIDVSDFLLAIAGAFGEELAKHADMAGANVIQEGYWRRFANWMVNTRVEVSELGISADLPVSPDLKLNLKQDPSFRQMLQKRLEGHIGPLTRETHQFFEDCYNEVVARKGQNARVIFLLDSIEQIRGAATNAAEVADSVVTLFHGHSDKLNLPHMHVVYTVPPWLKIKAPGVAGMYSGYQQIPCVKVRDRAGRAHGPGLDAMERIVLRRGDWRQLLGDRAALDEITLASGGYLRDLLRILQATLRLARNKPLPVSETVRRLAIAEIRNSYLPLSHADVVWLARVDASRACELPDGQRLSELARYFDNLLLMTYRNGDEWFGVHPLVVGAVRETAARIAAEETGE